MSIARNLAIGQGFLTVPEVDLIQQVVSRLPADPVCVNIGSGAGTSVIAVLEAREDAKIVDIDIDPMNGIAQVREAGYYNTPRYERIVGDSKAVIWPFRCDYLFIDGDHFEPGIRGDLDAWLPRVNAFGYVLLHDYFPYPAGHELAGVDYWPDVRKVANQMIPPQWVYADADRLRVYRLPW